MSPPSCAISAKVLMIFQIFVLISVCVAVVGIFMVAEMHTVDKLIPLLQEAKVNYINDRILQEVQPAVDMVRLYAEQNVQNSKDLTCAGDASTLQRLMDGFFRVMSAVPQFPYVYLSYAVNDTYWAECGCGDAGCDWFNVTRGMYANYDKHTVKFDPSKAVRHYERDLTQEDYILFIAESQRSGTRLRWSDPYVYYDYVTQEERSLITITTVLDFNARGNVTRAFSMDLSINFLNNLLSTQRKSNSSKDYLLMVNPETEQLIGSSIPGTAARPMTLIGNLSAKGSAFYPALRTPDSTTNDIARAIKGRANKFTNLPLFVTTINKEKYYCSSKEIHFPDGPVWVLLYAIADSEVMEAVLKARSMSYMFSAAVISISCAIGFGILQSVLSPLKVMSTIVLGAARMDVESISKIPKSNVTEVAALQEDVNFLVDQLKELRLYLPENILQVANASRDENNGEALPSKNTTINLCFSHHDGTSALNKPKCVFAFEFKEGKAQTFARLVSVCRQRAGIDTGQTVLFQWLHDGKWERIESDSDFFAAIALHNPDSIECRIGRHGSVDVKSLVRCVIGIAGVTSSAILAKSIWNNPDYLLTSILFLSFSMGILWNIHSTHTFLKHTAIRNQELSEWLQEHVDEASFGMFIGAFGVMNLEVIACKLTIHRSWLSLHAPFTSLNLHEIVRASVPGLFFGPIMSIIVASLFLHHIDKIHVVTITTLVINSVVLLHTAFSLVKISLFSQSTASAKPAPLSEEQIKEKMTECTTMALREKHVSLLFCVLLEYDSRIAEATDSTEIEVMCNQYYETVCYLARRFSGVVTQFNGCDVTILFNGTTDVEHHETVAAECAFAIMERKRVCCAIVSDVMKVGNLGTSTHRAFQHISPSNVLCESMAELAVAENCPLLVTQAVADACSQSIVSKSLFTQVTFMGTKVSLFQLIPAAKKRTSTSFVFYDKSKGSIHLGSLVHIPQTASTLGVARRTHDVPL